MTVDADNYKRNLSLYNQPEPIEQRDFDKKYQGFYSPSGPYTTFNLPHQYDLTALFTSPGENPPVFIATGHVFKVRGHVVAIEVLIVKNDESQIRWTHFSSLERL